MYYLISYTGCTTKNSCEKAYFKSWRVEQYTYSVLLQDMKKMNIYIKYMKAWMFTKLNRLGYKLEKASAPPSLN